MNASVNQLDESKDKALDRDKNRKIRSKKIRKSEKLSRLEGLRKGISNKCKAKTRTRIRHIWRKRALVRLRNKLREPGFKKLSRKELYSKGLTEFKFIIKDDEFYG